MFQPSQIVFVLLVGLSPLPVTVTTRIITFLAGDSYKPSFATGILGGGTTQIIGVLFAIKPKVFCIILNRFG